MTGVVNYFEIGSADPAAAQAFYGGVFDWTFGEPSPLAYRTVNRDQGGLWDTTAIGAGAWAVFYVQVDDVPAAISRAAALGASVAIPLVDNGVIEFAHLIDPDGNRFGVWCPLQPSA